MAITKMSIGVPPVNLFTVRRDVLRQCGRTPAMVAGLMEKIMSTATDELQDDELEVVTGGIIAILIGLSLSDARPSAPPPPVSK